MKRIIISLSIIAAISAAIAGSTVAFFSDTEMSTGNTFTAGSLDLKIDNECHYFQDNGDGYKDVGCPDIRKPIIIDPTGLELKIVSDWTLTDLGKIHKFFYFEDVKPGDYGEDTISIHVDDNDAWGCVNIYPRLNDDMSSTEPELDEPLETPEDPSDIWDGELAENMEFHVWADICHKSPPRYPNAYKGDNIWQPGCDKDLGTYSGEEIIEYAEDGFTLILADSNVNNMGGANGDPIKGGVTQYIGIEWRLPSTVGNIVQTDSFVADIEFEIEQHRNNPDFVCDTCPIPGDPCLK